MRWCAGNTILLAALDECKAKPVAGGERQEASSERYVRDAQKHWPCTRVANENVELTN